MYMLLCPAVCVGIVTAIKLTSDTHRCLTLQVKTQLEEATNELQTEEDIRQQVASNYEQVTHFRELFVSLHAG